MNKRQFDLFGYPAAPGFVDGSETSRAAAESITPSAATLRGRVLLFIKQVGPQTCDEVEIALGLRHQTASARIRELFLSGHLKDSGNVRRTSSGRYATVWEIPVRGQDHAI